MWEMEMEMEMGRAVEGGVAEEGVGEGWSE